MKTLKIILTILLVMTIIPLALVWQAIMPVSTLVLDEKLYDKMLPDVTVEIYETIIDDIDEMFPTGELGDQEKKMLDLMTKALEDTIPADEIRDIAQEVYSDFYYHIARDARRPEIDIAKYKTEYIKNISLKLTESELKSDLFADILQERDISAFSENADDKITELSASEIESKIAMAIDNAEIDEKIIFTSDWYDENEYEFKSFIRDAKKAYFGIKTLPIMLSIIVILCGIIIILFWLKSPKVSMVIIGVLLILFSFVSITVFMGLSLSHFVPDFVSESLYQDGLKVVAFKPIIDSVLKVVDSISMNYLYMFISGIVLGIGLCIGSSFIKEKNTTSPVLKQY